MLPAFKKREEVPAGIKIGTKILYIDKILPEAAGTNLNYSNLSRQIICSLLYTEGC